MRNASVATISPDEGPALAAARKGADIPRARLAKHADVDHTHLARFEAGERPISVAAYERLVSALADLLRGGAA